MSKRKRQMPKRYKMVSPLRRKAAKQIGKYVVERLVDGSDKETLDSLVDDFDPDYIHHDVSKVWDDIEGYVFEDIKHYTHQALRKEQR